MSADADDGWEVVAKDPFSANTDVPRLTLYTDGTGRLNAAADRALETPEAIHFLANADAALIGIVEAADPDDRNAYAVTRGEDAGGDIRPRRALERVGVDVATLEELDDSLTVDLDVDGDRLVADVSDLLDDQSAATRTGDRAMDATTAADDDSDDGSGESDSDDGDDGVGVACRYPDCDRTFDGETGRNIHEGQVHGDEELPDQDDHGETEVPDPEDAPSLETIRDCAEQVETVQELAGLLDVSVGEARLLARQADVYETEDGVRDDVAPMGVKQDGE